MSLRQSGATAMAAAAAVLLVAITVTACGSERGGRGGEGGQQAQSAVPRPSYAPRPLCAQAPEAAVDDLPASPAPTSNGSGAQDADRPPNYANNHAYRMSAPISEAKRARGEASAKLIRKELEKVREGGDFSDARIAAALNRLGCGPEHGVYIGSGYYSVHTGVTCVSGHITKDELTSEVHGAYAEPQPGTGPCVENRGGH